MEVMKLTLSTIGWFFGAPLTLLGVVVNMDNWKSAVIFILVIIFWLVKLLITIRKERQRFKEKELELQQKEYEFDQQKKEVQNGN